MPRRAATKHLSERPAMLEILVGFDAHFRGTCAYEGPKCDIRAGDYSDPAALAAALALRFPTATIRIV